MTLASRLRASLLFVCVVAINGCDDAPTSTVNFKRDDVRQYARAVMANGPLLVEVHGIAYDVDPGAFTSRVVEATRGAITWHAGPRLTTDPGATPNTSLRLVMTFNGGGGISGSRQCAGGGDDAGGPLDGGAVKVAATFCDGGDVLSDVRGSIAATDDANDTRFERLIQQVLIDMFSEQTHS